VVLCKKFFCAKRESATFSLVIFSVIFSVLFSVLLNLPFSILLSRKFLARLNRKADYQPFARFGDFFGDFSVLSSVLLCLPFSILLVVVYFSGNPLANFGPHMFEIQRTASTEDRDTNPRDLDHHWNVMWCNFYPLRVKDHPSLYLRQRYFMRFLSILSSSAALLFFPFDFWMAATSISRSN